jgi:hypothetical protein
MAAPYLGEIAFDLRRMRWRSKQFKPALTADAGPRSQHG